MMTFSLRAILFYIILSISYIQSVQADKIYTWQDENGNTHFGDKPAGKSASEIKIKPTSIGGTDGQERLARTQKYLDALSEDREERKQAREKAATEKKQRAEKCAAAKKSQQEISDAQFVYTESKSGEKTILDFEQRAAAEQRAANKVREFCGKN